MRGLSGGTHAEVQELGRGTRQTDSEGALLGLLEAKHVHRREYTGLPALNEGLGDAHEHRMDVDEGPRDEPQRAEDLDDDVVDEVQVAELCEAVEPWRIGAEQDRGGVVRGHELESDLHGAGATQIRRRGGIHAG